MARLLWSVPSVRWATVALAAFVIGVVARAVGASAFIVGSAFAACYVAGGWQPTLEGLKALRDRRLDVDLLMIVAALGAAAIGQYLDGALLIVIFASSGALEDVATRRTADSVSGLLTLAPQRAVRVGPGDAADEVEVDVAELAVGDHVLIRPGERISADGVVVDGASDVDQASITGESVLVRKAIGADVFAGTVNGSGALRVRVTADPADTVVARIVDMVAAASATKATTQLFIERIEQRYSTIVVVATVALLTIPLLFDQDLRSTLLRAMTFMIVASPCALVLATMPPLLSAIANAGRHGVLVKSAVALERLAGVDTVAFDKTGTLTRGEPRVCGILSEPGTSERELLELAAAAERYSEHPLGRAIVAAAGPTSSRHVSDFVAVPGCGVRAVVDGRRVAVVTSESRTPGDAANRFDPGATVSPSRSTTRSAARSR